MSEWIGTEESTGKGFSGGKLILNLKLKGRGEY